MKTIPLTQGKSTIVSDEDYEWASRFKWYARKHRSKFGYLWYAVRNGPKQNGCQHPILLHREIASVTGIPWSRQYDHKDGDGLNNQRGNIRPCTSTQNLANARKRLGCSSQFKGVSYNQERRKWTAHIRISKKLLHLGYFIKEEAAHAAYAEAAQKYFGEFARP